MQVSREWNEVEKNFNVNINQSKKELTSGVSSETKFGLLDTGRDSFGCPASLDDLVSVSTGMIMASWPWFSSLIILENWVHNLLEEHMDCSAIMNRLFGIFVLFQRQSFTNN